MESLGWGTAGTADQVRLQRQCVCSAANKAGGQSIHYVKGIWGIARGGTIKKSICFLPVWNNAGKQFLKKAASFSF